MNVTEQVVEAYFSYCKRCFTFSDVKIKEGEGRQLDLLAYDIENKIIYHIESSVSITHDNFKKKSSIEKLRNKIEYKFFGIERQTKKLRNKNFYQKILNTYNMFPVGFSKVVRVMCSWSTNEAEFLEVKKYIIEKYKIENDELCWLSFRDVVMPELLNCIETANYENTTLRMFSIFKAYLKSNKIDINKTI